MATQTRAQKIAALNIEARRLHAKGTPMSAETRKKRLAAINSEATETQQAAAKASSDAAATNVKPQVEGSNARQKAKQDAERKKRAEAAKKAAAKAAAEKDETPAQKRTRRIKEAQEKAGAS